MNDTIAAIATAHGVGSISIIRVSGDQTLELALKFTRKEKLTPRYAHLCKIYKNNGDFLDEALVIYFKAPYSFTGEDIVEFQLHGGFSLSEILLDELILAGARLANPGEFSKRACLNGKMDLLKALSIQDVIMSKSTSAANIIAKNIKGDLSKFLNTIRIDLVQTLAFVETSIDYADDDLPQDLLDQIITMCEKNSKLLRDIVDISLSKKGLIEGFKVAIIGKPNAGKSSLLNSLLAFDRAIVSNIAGTTRDRIEESLKIGSHLIKIIDTAGIRNADDEIEKIGVHLSYESIKEADIIIVVFDGSKEFEEEDERILQALKDCDKKIIYVLNKSDLTTKFEHEISTSCIRICAQENTQAIKENLNEYLNTLDGDGMLISNTLILNACKNASEAILRARDLLKESSLELFAFELNLAIGEIAQFTKDFERDEILDAMFSNFCLGK
ncbi:TPA: tRNA uridine-5-carboxymethylaminomethyl(34) synthesis GTPase MnmE [Campylobacter lari]|uniref:tRNA uridine-5-carboxymethylaminomethyl(34) synthesis GTPase MnmE n=1 Tax=Campylobacter lari TaxID=201 RepID=UPI001418D7BC|nr:tRNA uridine-5-carboxymethylaminomethyl(34) synthesis GTPase MnmE [Campylobacter lari]EAI8647206.1 tRNA uridine-5-carboxymethylaminomethyl(34) synthesis GTPase MnmE [Campylobacter lari]EAK3646632.1 tRNA uridine-5-carboxymethylaminomethyl(34) synthesis GTPase MnmE [Campylobacter lari]EKK0829659.1 tRNA uridine-5-carboxymethylaminomethyl(34) synthesis GTPase MnmE [Campylobacter lari]ELW5250368.1 tRNA uridine-5-carboxymethylaminomethyl(34) synthesis GTPase MnmE [Campylobacter lari]MCV3475606.1 